MGGARSFLLSDADRQTTYQIGVEFERGQGREIANRFRQIGNSIFGQIEIGQRLTLAQLVWQILETILAQVEELEAFEFSNFLENEIRDVKLVAGYSITILTLWPYRTDTVPFGNSTVRHSHVRQQYRSATVPFGNSTVR